MSNPQPTKSLGELERELTKAREDFEQKDRDERAARNAATDARNKLREIQKQIDAKINELKMGDKAGIWHDDRASRQAQMDAHHKGGRG